MDASSPPEQPLKTEIRALYSLAWRVSVLRLCMNGANFIGTVVVGKLGSEELAAAAYASAIITLTQVASLLAPTVDAMWDGAVFLAYMSTSCWRFLLHMVPPLHYDNF